MNYKEKDKRYVWHPFTQMKDWLKDDILMIDHGEGVWLYDTDGNRYLDGVSSLWVNVHGHRKQEIDQAIVTQMKRIAHSTFLGLSHPLAAELAYRLVQLVPARLKRVFYSDNGSTAMEVALKIAYQYWQQKENGKFSKKTKFVTFGEGYHGDTIGSVSLGGIDLFHKVYKPLLFETYCAPYPYPYRFENADQSCGDYCLSQLEQILQSHGNEIAAVVIEPEVQGAGGMIMTPPGFMKHVERLVRTYNTLLIVDEVATGFGRTGRMFASQIENIEPDIMAVAKGITGGYLPLAATITSEEIFNAFLGEYVDKKTFFHGHTYTANPLGCAAALANLDLFEKEMILENVTTRSNETSEQLQKFYDLDHVGDIRRKGLMIGIELVKNKNTKQEYEWEEKTGIRVIKEARRFGIIIRPLGNVIVLMPPLCITKKELEYLLSGTYNAIKSVTEITK